MGIRLRNVELDIVVDVKLSTALSDP